MQDQFLRRVQLVWIQFSFSVIGYHTKAKEHSLAYNLPIAQSAGAVEYTDCISAEG